MTRFIEHIIEPRRLLLCWQARDSESRSRYVVGELVQREKNVTLRYFTGTPEFKEALNNGFVGYPAFPIRSGDVHTGQVLEAFTRRLPPRNRRDFSRYLEMRGISPEAEISDFALLGYTGAKLPNDGFEIVHTFEHAGDQVEFVLEVAGFRHESTIPADQIVVGESVTFHPEPENQYDPHAIRIELRGTKIGYVARGHAPVILDFLNDGAEISGEVFRKNGTAERPLIYIFTQLTLSDCGQHGHPESVISV
ncbi:hypothetical protein Q667_17350 [Marinobacter sp. C1S70]|uniref:HIRAN domain-containing protein n=1 Tax=Marinobacter nauticus (strain ATCC 700491 / DSM 11845 / VT8) TaxID=351348 RepID=A1TWM3_MARN8|nr:MULTISPECIES: HIRAN domain-containing protein [Marinobacter]ABM17142.1 hypothetical protein Maqu_0035 [Marinobacter nauticus VT8]ERS85356.1 hypothetical protein Q667_17350 [Marinobacter sp. C1S70]